MEGISIYESSYNELLAMGKALSTDSIVINFNKLDTNSAGLIREAIASSIHSRISDVYDVIESSSGKV
jgi:hypothetical protein